MASASVMTHRLAEDAPARITRAGVRPLLPGAAGRAVDQNADAAGCGARPGHVIPGEGPREGRREVWVINPRAAIN